MFIEACIRLIFPLSMSSKTKNVQSCTEVGARPLRMSAVLYAAESCGYVPISCDFMMPTFTICLSSETAECFSEFGLYIFLDSTFFFPTFFFSAYERDSTVFALKLKHLVLTKRDISKQLLLPYVVTFQHYITFRLDS